MRNRKGVTTVEILVFLSMFLAFGTIFWILLDISIEPERTESIMIKDKYPHGVQFCIAAEHDGEVESLHTLDRNIYDRLDEKKTYKVTLQGSKIVRIQ